MHTAKLIGLRLLPVFAAAALLFMAQRLAVEAYWEIHPEAKLEAEFRRPFVQKALMDLREKRQKNAQEEAQKQEALEKLFEQWGLSKTQMENR